MSDKVKKFLLLIGGVGVILLGIIALLSEDMIILFCGLGMLVYGISTLITWSNHRKAGTASKLSFWIAIAAMIAGVAVMCGSAVGALPIAIVMVILGIWIIATGVFEIIGAVIYRKAMTTADLGVQAPGSIASMIFGGIAIFVGLITIFAPLFALYIAGVLIAIILIVVGVRMIINSFSVGAISKKEESV